MCDYWAESLYAQAERDARDDAMADAPDDTPTARDIAADEDWTERHWWARERHEEFWA